MPPGTFMAITGDAFTLTPRSQEPTQHLAVNFFLRSRRKNARAVRLESSFRTSGSTAPLAWKDINAEGDFKYLPQVFACYGSMFIPQARATIRIEQASTFKNALAAQRCCMHSSDGAGASDFRDFSGLSPAKENRTGSRWTLLIHSETVLAVPEPKQPGRRAPHIRFAGEYLLMTPLPTLRRQRSG